MVAPQLGSPAASDGSTWCCGLLDTHCLERGARAAPSAMNGHGATASACHARAVRALDIQAERRANLKRVVSFEEYASDPTGTLGRLLAELPYRDGQRPDVNALARAASHAGRCGDHCQRGGKAGAGVSEVGFASDACVSRPRLLNTRRGRARRNAIATHSILIPF